MKLSGFCSLLVFAVAAFADVVSYDGVYDSASTSLDVVFKERHYAQACSDELETQGYSTFGSLPGFPFIGGAGAVDGAGSTNCGTCWRLTYPKTGKTINVLAVDHAGPGTFNIALKAMNNLTNNQAVKLGRVTVSSIQVAKSACGL
ncbi:Cerato-platanin [Favolaschia claudopus]|uniref:Cerato-platanin n=1 Tax=Favolaschia claudopus TaxID=2862362 RepID=A0AAW0C3S2_9AGAR